MGLVIRLDRVHLVAVRLFVLDTRSTKTCANASLSDRNADYIVQRRHGR